jgi:hypothetical protein
MLKAWSLYRQLAPEQRQVLTQKQVEGTRPLADFLALLKPLARWDAAGDKQRRRAGGVAIASGVGTLAASWIGLAAGAPALFFAVPGGLAVTCLGLGLTWRKLRRLDLSDNLRHLALPLLRVLEEESRPDSPLTLKLDLRRPDIAEKLEDRRRFDGGAGRKIVESLYRDPWMSGRATLADGTTLAFQVVDEVRERRQTRRNARGKTKTKTKLRFWSTYRVAVALPDKHYTAPTPDAATKLSRTVKGDRAPRDPFPLLDLVAEVYRRSTLKAPPKANRP